MSQEARSSPTGFDLLHEPWITSLDAAGRSRELGILETLRQATDLTEIIDPSPLVVVAIVRLLEAVLLQALQLSDEYAWLDAWRAASFDDELFTRIQTNCAGRMDLFDAQRPFYQSSDVGDDGRGETIKSVGSLFPEMATGTAVTHYAHAQESEHAFCEVCCAKGLVSLPAFATSGGAGIKPSINGVPPLYVLPLGDTLHQTLLLNYVLPDRRPTMATEPDPGPSWASDDVVGHKQERPSVGFLESLTWQPRRTRLIDSSKRGSCTRCGRPSERLTTRIVFAQGWSRSAEALPWHDPWAAYTWRDGKTGPSWRPVRALRERDTWRDTGALYLSSAKASEAQDQTRRPAIVEQLDYLIHEGSQEGLGVHSTYRFLATGMRTDMKAKVFEWRSDRLEFPGHVLETRVGTPVGTALTRAELVARALGDALLRLHAAAARDKPPWGDIRSAMRDVIGTTQAEFWRRIEPTFRAGLFDPRLGGEQELQASWLAGWVRLTRDHASRALDSTLDAQGDSAADLRRAEAARRAFFYALKKGEPRDE